MGTELTIELLVRWLHVFFGIVWVGHLYFFNFVNVPFQGVPEVTKDIKKIVNPNLIARALFWFRWGAMMTFLTGLALFTQVYMYKGNGVFGANDTFHDPVTGGLSGRAQWIMGGLTLGTIMWFNVWFLIWPAQKRILTAVARGEAPGPALPKRAALVSKLNTYLSGPMLFAMLASAQGRPFGAVAAVLGVLVPVAMVAHLYMISKKVKAIG